MKIYINILFTLLSCAWFFHSCAEEEIISKSGKEENASVTFTLNFSDLDVISPSSRAAGDAIEKISDLCILFYNAETNKLINDYTIYKSLTNPKGQETFTQKIKSGSYKIYTVANMGNLTESSTNNVQTINELKNITLQWETEKIHKNNQMFGFFEEGRDNAIDRAIQKNGLRQVAPTAYDAPSITIEGAKTIYAKLYRAASKITIAYDGKDLNDNIFITIKSVSLKNIPASCGLWTENKPYSPDAETKDGEILSYKGNGLEVKNDGLIKGGHDGDALYMFENRQGINETVTTQKDKDPSISPDITKAGTYIEVQAHYANQSNSPGVATQFDIVYRYMLGEDNFEENIFNNFNVTRNRHYKITMLFSGSGKEKPVWRIEYIEEKKPEISVPNEIYISYLPNEQLSIPVAFPKATGNVVCNVTIKNNPWYYVGHRYDKYATDNSNGFLNINGGNLNAAIICSNREGIMTGDIVFETAPMSFRGTGNADGSFTGYNPFFAHQRIADVEIEYTYNVGEQTVTGRKSVTVRQTERIVNPMGIFRKANNNDPFNVTIMKQEAEEGDNFNFEPLDSYGPWTVSVDEEYSKGSGDWIKLRDSNGKEQAKIIGKSGKIHFTYQPDGTIGEHEVRCGRIKVTYHNNYCTHYIYVRQGYAPIALGNGGRWTSYNLIGKQERNGSMHYTNSPIGEGSFLKRNSTLGIVYQNNDRDGYGFIGKGGNDHHYQASDGGSYDWYAKEWDDWSDKYTNSNTGCYPNSSEYEYIANGNTFKAFGVVYDDSSTKTAITSKDAFGYTVESQKGKGMRGMLVQDKAEEHNVLFFPIGTKGYGRRRNTCPIQEFAYGALHYAYASEGGYDANNYQSRPLMADLYKHHGAIYWTQHWTQQMNTSIGLSFNYNVCNVEAGIFGNGSGIEDDACYARLILK